MGYYKIKWKSKRKKGIFTARILKHGWVKTPKDAREYFYRLKKYAKEFPKTAKIVSIEKKRKRR